MSQDIAPPETPEPKADRQYGGALAGIAERHEKIRAEKHLDLQVPGYEGLIKLRYRLLPEKEMDRQAQRIEDAQRSGDRGSAASMEIDAQLLVAMCAQIYVRDPEVDDWVVLEDKDGPVRLESRFAQYLRQAGVKVNDVRARDVALDFFSPREDQDNPQSARVHPQAMEAHTNAIVLWHRGEKKSISRRLLGE